MIIETPLKIITDEQYCSNECPFSIDYDVCLLLNEIRLIEKDKHLRQAKCFDVENACNHD